MLIDTNIFLEILFKQKRMLECANLLDAIKENLISENVYITRFSLGAIEACVRKKHTGFIKELLLLIYEGKILIPKLDITDDLMINSVREELGLDFDDAMQFVAVQKTATYLVTFDQDFKNKPIQIKTPRQILKKILK